MKTRYRETWAEINLVNLYENYKNVQNRVKDQVVIPVVKANAYGHGVMEVVEYLVSKGIDYFAVSLLEEALEIRKKFKDISILVMGVVENEGLLIASENNITVTICNLDQIENIRKYTEYLDLVQMYEKSEIDHFINITQHEDFRTLLHFKEKQKIAKLEHTNLKKIQIDKNVSKKVEAVKSIENLEVEQSPNSIEISKLTKILKVHLKVDTGMNRLGLKFDDEIKFAYSQLLSNPMIDLEGMFTHFSTADVDKSYYDIQMRRFSELYFLLEPDFRIIHTANSSAQIKYDDFLHATHTRLGISLYGLTLDEETIFLKNTFTLKSKISQFKLLLPGDKLGYGATYTASGHEIIGVLPIGYADGFIRKNQGGDVEINGKRYPIVGRICMDQLFVKVDESITKNDEVILFGGLVSIDEVAQRLDTINYEVICSIGNRVPREYIK